MLIFAHTQYAPADSSAKFRLDRRSYRGSMTELRSTESVRSELGIVKFDDKTRALENVKRFKM